MNGISKQELRERLLAERLRLDPDDRTRRSRQIAARVLGLPAFARARTIATYAALGAEVDPSEIGRAAAALGKRLAYPILREGERALAFGACTPEQLTPGAWRTREPPSGAPRVPLGELDLVLVPGVAFDAQGRRLGRGRGHYDATLAALSPGAARVGLAFELQLVPEVPLEAHDATLDAVVTESRVLLSPAARPEGTASH